MRDVLIDQAVVFGDRRSFVSALLVRTLTPFRPRSGRTTARGKSWAI